MADSFTQFSEMIDDLTKEERDWLSKILHFDPETENTDDLLEGLPQLPYSFEFDRWPGFEYDLNKKENSFWLYCDEGYCEENLCNILYAFIKKFRPDYIFTLSGGCTCSRPRIKEFGGIWLVISQEGVKGGNTWDAGDTAVEEILNLRKRLAEDKGPSIRRMPKKTKPQPKKG